MKEYLHHLFLSNYKDFKPEFKSILSTKLSDPKSFGLNKKKNLKLKKKK